jgi:hypothetical protein
LIITTYEQFPTEVRSLSTNICLSLGLFGGVALPFFNSLDTNLLVILLLLLASSSISVFFLRETKHEEGLKNLYFEIYRDPIDLPVTKSRRKRHEDSPAGNPVLNGILNQLGGLGLE